jgi:hypothetical protein
MYKTVILGDRAVTEPVEMPDSTRELVMELMAQNRMILEANCRAMNLISAAPALITKDDDDYFRSSDG